jgi:hypothetical protein
MDLDTLPPGTVVQFDGKPGWYVLADRKGKRVVLGPFGLEAMRRILDDPTFDGTATLAT